MDQRLQPLFTPWKIGNCEIKNRIVLTSMGGTDLFGWMEKNHFDKDGARFIMEVAKNNAGLVLPGCQPVYNPMFGQWLHKNKKMYADLKKWTPELHKTGAKLFVQLTAGFGRSFTISEMMEKLYTNPALRVLSKPFMDLDKITASASPSPNRWSDKVPSREMTKAEIKEFVNAFAESAKMLKDAGVDGVEVHAVHEGYLLDQFTLKYVNKRTDEYGGSFENRYRFAVEVVQAIKKACGDDFPVSLRYSIISKTKGFRQGALPGEAYTEAGRDMAESEKAVKYLQDAGYDCLNCDNGTYDAWYWAHPPIYMPENCNLEDVEYIKQFCDIPVICAGRLDPRVAADAIKEGKLDGAGFARQFLADQEWVTKMMNDEEDDIRPCILCHNGCFNMCHYKGVPNDQELSDSLHLSRCAINAETMQWNKHYIKKTNSPKTVHIVGGGIGGMECALVLKKRGHTPVIYEKSGKLGGMYNYASAMSFKEADKKLLEWYDRELKKAGIEVHLNTEIDPINPLTRQYDEVIICTGAVPKKLPVPGFNKTITFEELLTGDKDHGDKVVFFGGGQSACEAAYELVLQGKHPIIVEYANDLIATPGTCLANASFLREMLVFKKVPIYLEHSICEIGDGYVMVKPRSGGDAFKVECDSVVNGLGFRPAPVAPAGKHVRQVGTAAKWGNLRNVIWGAWDVCMKI